MDRRSSSTSTNVFHRDPAIAAGAATHLITEAFRNALTHSNASVIRISGKVDDRTVVVAVEDNGDGFDNTTR